MFWANLSKPVTVYENVFDCERYFTYLTYWGVFPFKEVWMRNVGVTNTKSGDYHFYFFYNPQAIHLWYLEYSGACSVFRVVWGIE